MINIINIQEIRNQTIDDRSRFVYDAFRGSFSTELPPHWYELPVWIRKAICLSYMQGKIDGHDEACETINLLQRKIA